jgi:MoxR-like ATPase
LTSSPEKRAEAFRAGFDAIFNEISKAIVGQRDVIRQTLITLFAGGHVLLEGVPGLGKTYLVRSLAQCLGVQFSRIQFTPDLMPADIIGTDLIVEDEHGHKRFEFQPGPVFTQVLLADEINRATPKTQSALLEAMQERTITVSGQTRPLGPPFFVLATQNPLEMEGTYPLPEAQLDRFFFKVWVPYPSLEDLCEIANRTTGGVEAALKTTINSDQIAAMQALVRDVPIAPHVERFAGRIVLATHPDRPEASDRIRRYVRYGASPRAMQTMVLAGKVAALLDGRFHVAFDDLAEAALPALRHRLILNFEGEAEGVNIDDLVGELLMQVPREAEGVA